MQPQLGGRFGCHVRAAALTWTVVGLLSACGRDAGEPPRPRPPGVELGRYPPGGRGDIDCPDLRYAVWVDGPDPYTLDADNDGIGCERYLGRPIPDSARLP
jgi:hypothetical protein